MNDKPHISASQLSMYWRCPEQYRRRYMEGEILPPGIALLTGGALHSGAEHNFRQKIDSRRDLPAAEIVDAAVAAFDARAAAGYALSDDEASRGAKIVVGEAKDQTAVLAGVHAEQQAPDYQPAAVEQKTRIVLPKASRDLLAITDLRDDQRRVVDIKTAARKKPQTEVDGSIQLTIYAAAYCIDCGQPPSEVRLDTLIKTKKPGRQVLASMRNRSDFQVLVNRVNATLAAMEAGHFPPCSPDAWQCSSKWCGYFRDCPYVNSERLEAAGRKDA
ncbi:MAG: PD-(D/E)XK nuclease family protein [Planctomycetota bacterium]|jgi:hypothetical protein